MNCKTYHDLVLLADSGEIDTRRRQELERHLAECGDCRAYRSDTRRMLAISKPVLDADGPGRHVIERIHDAALDAPRGSVILFRRRVAQALACAAALTAIAGGAALLLANRTARPVEELHAIIAMVGGEEAARIHASAEAALGSGSSTAPANAQSEHQLRALARQLLHMEGMSVEDAPEEDSADPGLSRSGWPLSGDVA
jgi:hypothetical protein